MMLQSDPYEKERRAEDGVRGVEGGGREAGGSVVFCT